MASIHRLRNGFLGEGGVVVIDGDQSTVRLVRRPAHDDGEVRELCESAAYDILRGFFRITESR